MKRNRENRSPDDPSFKVELQWSRVVNQIRRSSRAKANSNLKSQFNSKPHLSHCVIKVFTTQSVEGFLEIDFKNHHHIFFCLFTPTTNIVDDERSINDVSTDNKIQLFLTYNRSDH